MASTMEDGVLTAEEQAELEKAREELELGEDDADLICERRKEAPRKTHCPHCGESLETAE